MNVLSFKRPIPSLSEEPESPFKRRRPEENIEQRPASLKLDGKEPAAEVHGLENAEDWTEGSEIVEEQEGGEEDGEELGGEQGADPLSIVSIAFHDYSSKMQMRMQETTKSCKQVCLIALLFLDHFCCVLSSNPMI